jgi:hypothetical protein
LRADLLQDGGYRLVPIADPARRRKIAPNAGDGARQFNGNSMASPSSTSIARKARSKAEADFATWLMMAKLGSFDDLPANAQAVLTNYRARLDKMSEAESKVRAVREVYASYYAAMGGAGAAPEPEPRSPPPPGEDNVVRFQRPPKPAAAAASRSGAAPRRPIPALLIFLAMVAAIAAFQFLTR